MQVFLRKCHWTFHSLCLRLQKTNIMLGDSGKEVILPWVFIQIDGEVGRFQVNLLKQLSGIKYRDPGHILMIILSGNLATSLLRSGLRSNTSNLLIHFRHLPEVGEKIGNHFSSELVARFPLRIVIRICPGSQEGLPYQTDGSLKPTPVYVDRWAKFTQRGNGNGDSGRRRRGLEAGS